MNENLIPQSERTKDEQREVARLGGIASGEARRRKKNLREVVRMLLDEEIPVKGGGTIQARVALAQKLIQNAVKTGDTKAAKLVADWSGEAPTRNEITGEDGAPLLVTFSEIDARFKAAHEHKDD